MSNIENRNREPSMRSSSVTWEYLPIEIVCEMTTKLGFHATEVMRKHMIRAKTKELLKQFSELSSSRLGLEICALNNIDGQTFDPFGGRRAYTSTLQNLKEAVDMADGLGVKDVFVWEGIRPKIPKSGARKKNDKTLLDTVTRLFREAINYSAPKKIGFITEPHPFTLGMDLDFLIKLCDSLDRNYFGVLYDCCHFGVGKPNDYIEPIRALGKRIKHIHFSDSDQKSSELHFPPGMGRLDLNAIVSAFKEIDYQGTITLDLYGYPMPEEGSKIGILALKDIMLKLGLTNRNRD